MINVSGDGNCLFRSVAQGASTAQDPFSAISGSRPSILASQGPLKRLTHQDSPHPPAVRDAASSGGHGAADPQPPRGQKAKVVDLPGGSAGTLRWPSAAQDAAVRPEPPPLGWPRAGTRSGAGHRFPFLFVGIDVFSCLFLFLSL